MNRACLTGRLVRDPDPKKTTDGVTVLNFTLAVPRKFKKEGQPDADFIDCIAWRQSAEYLSKYSRKGDVIEADGWIRKREYDGRNGTVYVTEIVCDEVKILNNTRRNEPEKQEVFQTTLTGDSREERDMFHPQNDVLANSPELQIETDDLPFY